MNNAAISWARFLAVIVAAMAGTAAAQDVTLAEEKEILISCRLPPEATWKDVALLNRLGARPDDKAFSYRLWLPRGYLANPEKRYPAIFISSAGGNARMGAMQDWIVRHEFIAVMLVESKNGPWGNNLGNFLAAHDDVVQRCRIQEGMKWATGLSGGARSAACFVQMRPGFSGLILQGAGGSQYPEGPNYAKYQMEDIKAAPWLSVAVTMGNSDVNLSEADRVKAYLRTGQAAVFRFEGGHVWAPAEVFNAAADWVLRRATLEAPPDPSLTSVYAQQYRQMVQSAQSAPDPWSQFKRLGEAAEYARARNVEGTPEGRDLLPRMNAEMSRLRNNPAVSRQLMAADTLARYEKSIARLPPAAQREQLKAFLAQFADTDAAAKAQQLLDAVPDAAPMPSPRPRR